MEPSQVFNDPKYQGLPEVEKSKVAERILPQDPKFFALPDTEKAKVLNHFVSGKSTAPTKRENLGSMKNIAGGVVEPLAAMATGVVGKVAGDVAGLADIPLHAAGLTKTEPADVQKGVSGALTYKPQTAGGKEQLSWYSKPFQKYEEKVSKPMGKMAGGEDTAIGRATHEAFNQALGFAGVKTGIPALDAAGKMIEKRGVGKILEKAERAPALESAKMAKDYGFMVGAHTLSVGKPTGAVSHAVGALTQKTPLEAVGSVKNATRAADLLRDDWNIPKGKPLTKEVFKNRIAEESTKMEKIREFPAEFKADPEYVDDILSVGNTYREAARQFPETHGRFGSDPLIQELTLDKSGGVIQPSHALDNVRVLRDKAVNYLNSSDAKSREMGMIYRDAAKAQEGLIERNLKDFGQKQMYDDYVAAREKMAKLYDGLSALHEPSGTIDPSVYGEIYGKGKPLTGNAAIVGRMANAYPKFFKSPSDIASQVTGTHIGMLGAGTEMIGIQPALRAFMTTRKIPRKNVDY